MIFDTKPFNYTFKEAILQFNAKFSVSFLQLTVFIFVLMPADLPDYLKEQWVESFYTIL